MPFDILLKHGKVIDGKGNPWFRGDVAIAEGRIQAVASCIQGDAREELDVSRFVVCPGFIDAHTHSDYVFFLDPTAQSKVRQGVTTEVIGNCGMSGAPYFGGRGRSCSRRQGGLFPSGNRFQNTWRRWENSRSPSTSRPSSDTARSALPSWGTRTGRPLRTNSPG